MITFSIIENDFVFVVVVLYEGVQFLFLLAVVVLVLEITGEYNEETQHYGTDAGEHYDGCLCIHAVQTIVGFSGNEERVRSEI